MHYQLFLPKVRGATNEHLKRVGLDHLAKVGNSEWADVGSGGPDGGWGMICTWRSGNAAKDPPLVMSGDWQWVAAEADSSRGLSEGRYWFGTSINHPPTSTDLALKSLYPGNEVFLLDAARNPANPSWTIPAAAQLPHRGRFVNGEWVRMVKPEYQEFYETANKIMLQVFDQLKIWDFLSGFKRIEEASKDPQVVTVSAGYDFCCQALMLNYRVTPEIVDALELLDDSGLRHIIAAVIDWTAIAESHDQKKSEVMIHLPLGSTTFSGDSDQSDRRSPTTSTH